MKFASLPRSAGLAAGVFLATLPAIAVAQTAADLSPAQAPTGGPLAEAVALEVAQVEQGRVVQQNIDRLADETDVMLSEYRVVLRRLEALLAYNRNMEEVVGSQQAEIDSINTQLGQLKDTQVQLVPLMERMIDTLGELVEADVPFLPTERRERVQRLREGLVRADFSIAEKYRQIMEAYQVELDYARTIETYSEQLAGTDRTVNFLRLGRVALYYQTGDESETAIWDQNARRWQILEDTAARLAVRNGIRMALKQSAPDLLTVPVPAPTTVSAR